MPSFTLPLVPALKRSSFALLALLVAGPAAAETVRLGSVELDLPIPEGHCALDPGNPAEAEQIAFMGNVGGGLNRLLVVFMDCDELEKWRSSGRIDVAGRFGTWAAALNPLSQQVHRMPNVPRSEFLRFMETALSQNSLVESMSDTVVQDVTKRANEQLAGIPGAAIDVGKPKLGLLESTPEALYMAHTGQIKAAGRELAVLGVGAISLIEGYTLTLTVNRVHQGESSHTDLHVLAKRTMTRAVAANPD